MRKDASHLRTCIEQRLQRSPAFLKGAVTDPRHTCINRKMHLETGASRRSKIRSEFRLIGGDRNVFLFHQGRIPGIRRTKDQNLRAAALVSEHHCLIQ